MENKTLDIIQLIEQNPITKLSKTYQSKLLNKIKDKMNTKEQQLFVSSFYSYLNYNKDDYIIDLDDVWKWIGFSTKANAKKTLGKIFAEPEDYKIVFIQLDENTILAGRPSEQILMSIKTFKKLCLKANTKKSNELHDYYLNLEEVLNETVNEESNELRLQLEENKELLDETQKELKKEKILRNKMLRRNYYESVPGHTVYLYKDIEYDIEEEADIDVFKVGKSTNVSEREKIYAALSKNGKMLYVQYTYNCHLTEKVIQHLLDKYRPNKMTEWFKNVSVETAINTIKTAVLFLDGQLKDIDVFIPQTKESLIKITGLTGEENKEKVKSVKTNIKVKVEEKEDYKKFIKECCELKNDKDYNCPKQDLKNAYKIWSKKNVITEAETYFNETFKENTINIGDISRLVYKNIKLLPLKFKPNDPKNVKDYETFIIDKCGVNYQYRTSFIDFFKYFTEYKQKKDINYKLTYQNKQNIQKNLENVFFKSRIYLSSTASSKHLTGVYGLGIEINNFGSNIRNRNNKRVFQFNSETGKLVKSWDSLTLASKELQISNSTLSDYINHNRTKKNYIYKYNEFENDQEENEEENDQEENL